MSKIKTKTEYKLVYASRKPEGLDIEKTTKAFVNLREKGWTSYKRAQIDDNLNVVILGREQQVLTGVQILAMLEEFQGQSDATELKMFMDKEFMILGDSK